jgi:hypothetical protein
MAVLRLLPVIASCVSLAHLALSCSPVQTRPLEAMACVFYTQPGKYLTLIHINEADKFQLRLLERLVTTCRSTPR